MYKSFSFNLVAEGTPDQHIWFRIEGEPDVKVNVADMTFPADIEPRFRAMYQVLVDRGLIANLNPIFNPG